VIGRNEDLLRRLAVQDEDSLRTVLALGPGLADPSDPSVVALTPKIGALVRVAALVALDAPTCALRWAVELASCAGADDDDIVAVLLTLAPDLGVARLVSIAPRLALAIGYDIEVEGWDGC
jgi:4-carboxymuconolactone decarboxylase